MLQLALRHPLGWVPVGDVVALATEISNWRRQGKTDKWITEYLLLSPSKGQETVAAAFDYLNTGKLPASTPAPARNWLTARTVAIGGGVIAATTAIVLTAIVLHKRKSSGTIAGARSKKQIPKKLERRGSGLDWYLETIVDDFVVWGYGPKSSVEHVERAEPWIEMAPGHKMSFPFELPEHRPEGNLPPPHEYRRVKSLAWRWNAGDGTHATDWRLASSQRAAVADARKSLEHQRFDTQAVFKKALRDIRRAVPTPPPTKRHRS